MDVSTEIPDVPIWFVCRMCGAPFQKLPNFIEHKKKNHFQEFHKSKCIVFEETSIRNPFFEDSHELPSTPTHNFFDDNLERPSGIPQQEPEFIIGDQMEQSQCHLIDLHPSIGNDPRSSEIIDLDDDVIQIKTELVEFESKADDVEVESRAEDFETHLYTPVEIDLPTASGEENHGKKKYLKKLSSCKKSKSKEVRQKSFRCPQPNCFEVFQACKSLVQHGAAVHADERPFKCTVGDCTKAFKLRYDLKIHMTTHTGDRKYKCHVPNCDKSFLRGSQLISHIHKFHLIS